MFLRLLSLVVSSLGLFMFTGCHVHHHDDPGHTRIEATPDPVIVVPARGDSLYRDPDGEIDD